MSRGLWSGGRKRIARLLRKGRPQPSEQKGNKARLLKSCVEQVLEETPFISFEQPGQGSDGERQRIIRKHLGRRRKKNTPQREAANKSTKDVKQDILGVLCMCSPSVPDLLHTAARDGRSMALEPCTSCGKSRLVESMSTALSSPRASPDAGPICDNFADPFSALPVESNPYIHGLIQHCEPPQPP